MFCIITIFTISAVVLVSAAAIAFTGQIMIDMFCEEDEYED